MNEDIKLQRLEVNRWWADAIKLNFQVEKSPPSCQSFKLSIRTTCLHLLAKSILTSRFPSLGIPRLDLEYPRWNTYVGHWNSYVGIPMSNIEFHSGFSNSNLGIPRLGNRLVKNAAVEKRVQL